MIKVTSLRPSGLMKSWARGSPRASVREFQWRTEQLVLAAAWIEHGFHEDLALSSAVDVVQGLRAKAKVFVAAEWTGAR